MAHQAQGGSTTAAISHKKANNPIVSTNQINLLAGTPHAVINSRPSLSGSTLIAGGEASGNN
jgi:hypothetical protein